MSYSVLSSIPIGIEQPFVVQRDNPVVVRRRRLLQIAETVAYMIAVIICMTMLNWFMASVVTGANRSWSAVNTRRLARAFRAWRWKTFYFLPAALLVFNLIHRRFIRGAVISLISLVSRVFVITWVLNQFYLLASLMYRLQRRQSDQIWSRDAISQLTMAGVTFGCIFIIESLHIIAIFARAVADLRRSRYETLPIKDGGKSL